MLKNIKNLDFELIIQKGKPLAIAAVCLAAMFAAGYGVGRSGSASAPTKRSLNNNISAPADTNTPPTTPTPKTQATNTPPATGATGTGECYIKGSKSKIYHLPGGAFYNRTNPAACFNSEEEAIAAGYKKSSR